MGPTIWHAGGVIPFDLIVVMTVYDKLPQKQRDLFRGRRPALISEIFLKNKRDYPSSTSGKITVSLSIPEASE